MDFCEINLRFKLMITEPGVYHVLGVKKQLVRSYINRYNAGTMTAKTMQKWLDIYKAKMPN